MGGMFKRGQLLKVSFLCNACFMNTFASSDDQNKAIEKRLLGEWVSDRKKTIEHFKFRDGLSQEKRKKLVEFFGRLKIRYSPTEMVTEMDGISDSGSYEVIASDKDSVVIKIKDYDGSPKLVQMHFIENGYYVVSGFSLEFFKRKN